MNDQLKLEQALEIVAKSCFLGELVGKRTFKRIQKNLPELDSASLTDILNLAPGLEDSIHNIKSDKFLTYRIESDDSGGSECGPWEVNVHGACGVWVTSSVDYDDLWFSDRDAAISAAYDYAHESIIETIDHGLSSFQMTNAEAKRFEQLRDDPLPLRRPVSDPDSRVLGFYLEEGSNQIYSHNKYGPDAKADISILIAVAYKYSYKEVASAIVDAQKLGWHEAAKALSVLVGAKRRLAGFEDEIKQLKQDRKLEIEVDDWCRQNGIVSPQAEHFLKMAAELKPHFHCREQAREWDEHQAKIFHDAHRRVAQMRERIETERSRPEEQ